MTDDPGDDLRAALRDLLPDYRGPADPYARVGAVVRRRRRNARRTWLAVGVAGAAAAVAVVPALAPGGAGSLTPGAPRDAGPPVALPGAQPVAAGTVAGQGWEVSSTSLSAEATRCLYGDGGPFSRSLSCFADWTPARNASWVVLTSPAGAGARTTGVLGVVPVDAERVSVLLLDGRTVTVPAARTGTDPAARFFALAVSGRGRVASVTTLTLAGVPLADPDTAPDTAPGCVTPSCVTGVPARSPAGG